MERKSDLKCEKQRGGERGSPPLALTMGPGGTECGHPRDAESGPQPVASLEKETSALQSQGLWELGTGFFSRTSR